MDDFAAWVARYLHHGIDAERLRVLLARVDVAADRLLAGDTERRSTPKGETASPVLESRVKRRARAQRGACSEYSQVLSLALWVRMCGEDGGEWLGSACAWIPGWVQRYLLGRTSAAAAQAGWRVTRCGLR